MKLQLVAIRDQQLDAYMRPFFVQTTGQATRMFGDEATRDENNNEIYKHPEDYALFHLGTFDDNTGEIAPLDRPHQLAIASQFTKE